jgi:hypothetical protein
MHACSRINEVIGTILIDIIKAMITSLDMYTYKYVLVVHHSMSIKRLRYLCPARPPSASTVRCQPCRSHHF